MKNIFKVLLLTSLLVQTHQRAAPLTLTIHFDNQELPIIYKAIYFFVTVRNANLNDKRRPLYSKLLPHFEPQPIEDLPIEDIPPQSTVDINYVIDFEYLGERHPRHGNMEIEMHTTDQTINLLINTFRIFYTTQDPGDNE